jgi:hypothetical protein
MSVQSKAATFTAALIDLVEEIAGGGNGAPAPAPARSRAAAAEPAAPAKRTRKSKAAPPEVTLEDVRTSLIALNDARDKQAVIEVLSRFGVAKIGDLPEENYAEAKEAADAEAAEEEPDPEDDPFG